MSLKERRSRSDQSYEHTFRLMFDAVVATLSAMTRAEFTVAEAASSDSRDESDEGSDGYIAGCFHIGDDEVLILFSGDAVSIALDYLAGGHAAHFTPIRNRPVSSIDLMMFETVLRASVPGIEAQSGERVAFAGLLEPCLAIKSHKDRKNTPDISLTMASPKAKGKICAVALNALPSVPASKQSLAQPGDSRGFPQLDIRTLVEWLSSELPQTVALTLHLLDKKKAAQVIMRLPEPLGIDAAARFVCICSPNEKLISCIIHFARGLQLRHAI